MANAASPGDIESLARQYWETWSGLLGNAPAAPWPGMGGLPPAAESEPAAFDWYTRMQRVAAQFADGGSASDIAAAWRTMLGGQDGGALAGVLGSMPGVGVPGGAWPEQVRPFVEALIRPLRQQAADWLGRPGLGPAREHQQRLQALASAWQEWEARNEAFNALLARVGQDAFARFERMLQQHDSPERRLATARALFDLWIDAAEEAWAEAALSEDYQRHYADLTNALMRVRQGLQGEVERMGALLGLPGRTELDAVHRKVAELERSVHALRRAAGLPRSTAAADGARADASAGPVRGSHQAVQGDLAHAPVRKRGAGSRAASGAAAPAGEVASRTSSRQKAASKATRQPGKKQPTAAVPAKPAKTTPVRKVARKGATAAGRDAAARTGKRAPQATAPKPASPRSGGRSAGGQTASMKDRVERNTATAKAGDGRRGGGR